MNVKLGFDLNCFTNRYPEPEAWTDFVASCGVRVVQFNFDLLDFTWPDKIQERLAARTLDCCRRNGIRIKCVLGGHHHHQHYLGDPDDELARSYEPLYHKMAHLTAMLGGEGFGTCFAIMSVRTHRDAALRAEVMARAVEIYHRVAEYSRGLGLQYLLYEATSVPRESGATFAENDWILAQMRDAAIPMRLCLDVGHRNQEDPAAPEADSYAWIERYGRMSPLIHTQQSNRQASHHWPFTPDYNARGDIVPERVLRAIEHSGATHEILLALEIRHRAYYPEETRLDDNLRASVAYWRQWVPE